DARNDHRIAMAAAILATAADAPTIIHSPGCVRKSYPSFWSDFHRLQGNNKCMKNA
ncbi:MAG: 3-phosphoshikimate 1-carboxyvinyltransferase, partial [Kiritimatiellae bacterium]|nr:3-phosphoshikimate 1-carboxyvinyltransferase [Kiritimatiellia bacterium]